MAHNIVETNTVRRSHDVYNTALINQYELVSALGEGMHGKVMLARNSITGEDVAIKIMKRNDPHNRRLPKSNRLGAPPMSAQQETESKIRREIAVMKKCSHQNLVQLREVIDDPESKKVYLVMENLAGGEVKWRSKSFDEPVLELGQVQRIMRDVTLGLEYLHHQGIIHRDIKPANLLWTADRQSVKICDFGVSHFNAAADQNEAGLAKTAGSPAFFAPEVCHIPNFTFDDSASSTLRRGSQSSASPGSPPLPQLPPITKQIDIWALGVTFYCLLFGKPPWQGQTEFAMFRAICTEEFEVPDTMALERIPTGGTAHRPEGKDIGWCVVDLLQGLLEKDQDKRIKLSDIKRIPWIQNGVREPERWLRETAPESQSPVTITDEDTQEAIRPAQFSWRPRWVTLLTRKIKRVPLPLISRSRSGSRGAATSEIDTGPTPGPSNMAAQSESLGRTRSSRTRSVVDRRLKRFTFSNSSPTRANTVPGTKDRRNSSAGRAPQHAQSFSDPSSQLDRPRDSGSGSLRSSSVCNPASGSLPLRPRRPSESLQPPLTLAGPGRGFFFGATNSSISPAASPTTPDEAQFTGTGLKARLSSVIRKNSYRVVSKARGAVRSGRTDDRSTPRGRTSAETLDVPRASEDLGLTLDRRASSWLYGAAAAEQAAEDDDGRASVDLTGSEAGGGGMQDFNKSVVRFGAGGYVDRDTASNTLYRPLSTPGASGSGATAARMSTHSDSSSNSTATTATPHPHVDVPHHPPRVTSPLAHAHRAFDSDSEEDEEDLSSDVYDENALEDDEELDSSDDEVLELRTRRPSTVLSRSADVSPLR